MNDRQRRLYERGQRVDVYMDAAAEDFPAGKAGIQAARLKELLTQLSGLDSERETGEGKRRQGTMGRATVRTALRKLMKKVWDTSQTIAIDHPDIKGLFKSPTKFTNDLALAAAGRAYADAAAPLIGLFEEYHLEATVLNDLRSKADSLQSFATLQNEGNTAGLGTTASVETTLREMDVVIERLDTHVTNKYPEGSPKLVAWRGASRVESAPRRKPEDDGGAPPAPPDNG
ncbi:MAG: hypothetical protein JOZ02_03810 [Acidobacteria bacterium]|nr:hypothetical protein [Acidobacteriota bacterium]